MDRASSPALRLIAARAFAAARWRALWLRDRAAIARHHRRQLDALLRRAARTFPYYERHAGQDFEQWPVMDKMAMLASFALLNTARLSAQDVRARLASGNERAGGWVIGQSTGTSGNRGYYVISDAERFVWLGTLLAKALPDALWRRHRVALALPGLSSLYRSAASASRIALGFFDLARGIDAWAEDFRGFGADTVVAPPRVLRLLAERGLLTAPRIFSGSEVLDPLDRAAIEDATGRKVREIYMATEGLFGVSCAHGTLHLAEDVVHFEWEGAADGSALRIPIVTDFTRTSQAMIRYRMNDLIEHDAAPCPCGSAFQPVRQIVGRADDIVTLSNPAGGAVTVTPDVLRNAVVDADPRIDDFRIVQTGPAALAITLPAGMPMTVDDAVRENVMMRLASLGVAPLVVITRGIDAPVDRKLRRVEALPR